MKSYYITFIFWLLTTLSSYSQWERVGGPFGSKVYDFITTDNTHFARTSHGFYFFNADNNQWQKLNEPELPEKYSSHLVKQGDFILVLYQIAGVEEPAYTLLRSENNGETWNEVSLPSDTMIRDIVSSTNGIYLLGSDKLFISTNQGESWQTSTLLFPTTFRSQVFSYDNSIFVTDSATLYKTLPGTDEWSFREITGNGKSYNLYVFDTIYFALALPSEQLYVSMNAGVTWNHYEARKWNNSNFIKVGNNFYSFKDNYIYRSTNYGITFSRVTNEPLTSIEKFANINDFIISTSQEGILVLDTIKFKPTFFEQGLDASKVSTMILVGNDFWMGVTGRGIVKMDKSNADQYKVLFPDREALSLLSTPNAVFAATDTNHVLYTLDEGITWKTWTFVGYLDYEAYELSTDSLALYVHAYGPDGHILLRRAFSNGHWEKFVIPEIHPTECPRTMYNFDGYTFAVYNDKIARKNKNGSWELIVNVTANSTLDHFIHSNGIIGYIQYRSFLARNYIYFSEDYGTTWKKINTDSIFPDHNFYGFFKAIFINKDIIAFCGTPLEHMYISHDLGEHWEPFNQGRYTGYVDEFLVDHEYVFLSTYGQSLYRRKLTDIISSTNSIETKPNCMIYPNPNFGQFEIIIPPGLQNTGEVYVSDLNGRTLKKLVYSDESSVNIDISDLSPSIYIITIVAGDKLIPLKTICLQ